MRHVLVTGVAGFIGMHVARALIARGDHVVGLDNLNDYYDVGLKRAARALEWSGLPFRAGRRVRPRRARWRVHRRALRRRGAPGRAGRRALFADQPRGLRPGQPGGLPQHARGLPTARHEPPGLRQQLQRLRRQPQAAVRRERPGGPAGEPVCRHQEGQRAGGAQSYSHFYGIAATGLRFFTVYGPWGRPDMAYWSFARDMLAGRPIALFNHGWMRRDFTHIDDIVASLLAVLDRPPVAAGGDAAHRVLNIGSHRPVALTDFVGELERALGVKARIELQPMQPGDVTDTFAEVSALQALTGAGPETPLRSGIERFARWYVAWHAKTLRQAA